MIKIVLFRFRFKTNHENGVLLYSRSTQHDYLALQLVEARLLLNINLGNNRKGGVPTEHSMTLGSLLDDNNFHEVYINRTYRDIELSVDRVKIRDRIPGEFMRLDLDQTLFIGGVDYVKRGLVVYDNFTGCMENLYFNHSNVFFSFQNPLNPLYSEDRDKTIEYEKVGSLGKDCRRDEKTIPVTFKTENSFVRQTGFEGNTNLNISLEFRTFEQNGLIMFHKFSSDGYVQIYMERARIKVKIQAKGTPEVKIDNFDQTWNDGTWHQVVLSMSRNEAIISMDKMKMVTSRIMDIRSGAYYLIGKPYI
jgi:hypothetical protein